MPFSLSLPRVWGGEGGVLGLAAVNPSLWAHCPICTVETDAVTGGFTQTGSQGNSNIPLDLAREVILVIINRQDKRLVLYSSMLELIIQFDLS